MGLEKEAVGFSLSFTSDTLKQVHEALMKHVDSTYKQDTREAAAALCSGKELEFKKLMMLKQEGLHKDYVEKNNTYTK